MRSPLLALALLALAAPVSRAQDGRWEPVTETRELPGRHETRTRTVWQPPRVEIEERARNIPGCWSVDVGGNRYWTPPRTIVERVQVCRPGEWKTVTETVWVAGGTTSVQRQVWVPARRGPWDDAPRAERCETPRVTVQPIGGTGGDLPRVTTERWPAVDARGVYLDAPPSSARLREPALPVTPRTERVAPWSVAPPRSEPVRDARPLRLVQRETPAPATCDTRSCDASVTVVAARSPAPTVVVRAPAPRATVVVTPPCPPRVYVAPRCDSPRATIVVAPPRPVYVAPRCDAPRPVVVSRRACDPVVVVPSPRRCAPQPRLTFGVSVGSNGRVRGGVGFRFGF